MDQSFNKNVLSTLYVLDSVLVTEVTAMNKIGKNICPLVGERKIIS